MQSHRILKRLPVTQAKRALLTSPSTRKMAFFPRTFISEPASFQPFFKFLEDFDNYSNPTQQPHKKHRGLMQSFQPKFDVKEVQDHYELHGELPGIDQKDIEIEFTDNQTISVKGRVERSYESGTRPGSLEAPKQTAAIEGTKNESHRATVEDEDQTAKGSGSQEVAKAEPKAEPQAEQHAAGGKLWVSERSVGEFSRSFTFPVRVDQDAVKASMSNGILSVIVPKAKKAESRKITIT